jgi:hypothetical protein
MRLDPTPLTKEHLYDWTIELPDDTYVGYAGIDEGGICRAFGVIYIEDDGRAWAMTGGPIPPWGALYAARVFKIMDEVGLEVFAECDETIPGAGEWMEALGFRPVAGTTEWKRGLPDSRSSHTRHERRRRRQENERPEGAGSGGS